MRRHPRSGTARTTPSALGTGAAAQPVDSLRRIADSIVIGQARHRLRARWAILAGTALVAAVAVPTAIVVDHATTPAASRGRPADGMGPSSSPAAALQKPSVDAAVYTAVLIDWRPSGALLVHDRICTSASGCSAGRATQKLRRELRTRVGTRLRFTPKATGAIELQAIAVHGARASVSLRDSCGKRCFSGERVHLTRTGTTWRITGDREQWIT